jgi:PIN domain nuclease of toxin-antitoxin system
MNNILLLDACALIAYFKKEKGFDLLVRIFATADQNDELLMMHILTLLEVYYGFYKDNGKETAELVLQKTLTLPIKIVETFGYPEFREVGRLKSTYKISFADSTVLGIASANNYRLLTADHHEFDTIEQNEKIAFKWVR